MRARKNKNTIIRQYQYSVSTDLRPLPNELWEVARRMRDAWNGLIVVYAGSGLELLNREYAAAYETFRTSKDEAAYRATKIILDARKRATWISWDQQARAAVKAFDLDYSQGPNVIERFNGCIKAGRTCFPESELTHVQIPFVFPGSAAIPVDHLFNSARRWRIVIEGHSEAMFADNTRASRRERRMLYLELGLTKQISIPLRLDLHRDLPKNGIVKRVLLCGKKIPFRGWRWHVLFQVEMPISQTLARSVEAVSLRICWTRLDDVIVVAQWRDSSRQGILALPLTAANSQDRRTVARRPEWTDWLMDYRDLSAYKATEFALPKGSDERMKMRERRRRVEERWQSKRRWLYRNFAAWLVREFQTIRLPALDIKGIAEDDEKTGALAGADHNRQIAAPGDLLSLLKEAAQKCGRRVETFSQTSTEFQPLKGQSTSLRNLQTTYGVQVFDVAWNSKAVAGAVRAG